MKFHLFLLIPVLITCKQGGPGRHFQKLEMENRMAFYHVPGVSIAMIDRFRISWTAAFGVTETGTGNRVADTTLFQSGSIGKTVVASAMMHFIEEVPSVMDQDINQFLTTWKVPVNSFTRRTPVTVRRLLTHTAGVTLPGVIGYTFREPLPDLRAILDGVAPANTPPVRVDQVPGVQYRYSGGGFMILQQLMSDLDQTDALFPEIIDSLVFIPSGMEYSTFDYTPGVRYGPVSAGHRCDGSVLEGKWYRYPEMGMGVFWTTPSDMARFLIQLMQVYNGQSGWILSEESVREMCTPQVEGQGLGLRIADDGRDRLHIYHRGAVEGFQTFLLGYPLKGQGIVIMTNGDNGYGLIREILHAISMDCHWFKGIYI